ncbi:MAG: AAA family ATPase [Candidatus Dojkabacteria bacterium]|nr:MAG: AAA family ATPase [Candidatus Dojkabacteria bacterium]
MTGNNPFDPFGDNDDPYNGFSSYRGPSERTDITQLFSERTKEALQKAAEIAVEFGQRNIDSEHMLLALLRDGELMTRIFKELDIDVPELSNYVTEQLAKGTYQGSSVGITPRAKQILQLAFQEAMELAHNYIGTEHILLAILRENEGLGAQILRKHAISLPKLRQAVIKIVGKGDKEGEAFKSKSQTPELDKFSKDLTDLARKGKIDPVVGRADEITRIVEILARRKKNNPVLIGEPGVGKTAIVEGLAQRIITGNVPDVLQNKQVKALDLGLLLGGSKFRGEFEERASKLIKELEDSERDIILFIDELHTIVGSGAREGELDLANMLKPALARGEMQVIGATTLNEYKKYIEKDAALERRFQPILVEEPTVEQTIEVLRGIRDKYEAHHRIKITDESLVAAAELSDRYIKDRFLPDKAIDAVDEAASKVRLRVTAEPEELRQLRTKIKLLETERESLSRVNKHKEAAELKVEIEKIKEQIKPIEESWQREIGTGTPEVSVSDVAEVISNISGVPVKELKIDEKAKLLNLEDKLHERVIGQDEAIQLVAESVRRARVGLKNPNRPISTFIFLGPTGVGKTELAKALAEVVFGDEEAMIRLDMSEYMERHSVARLIGSPPGYIGYEEGGQLTEKVRRHPYAVILLDEIEKAHADVYNILLQVFDDGRLTDGKGRTVDFRNTIIIATSNVGSPLILEAIEHDKQQKTVEAPKQPESKGLIKMKQVSKDADKSEFTWERTKEKIMDVLKSTFRPEFLNRVDEIIIFKPLEQGQLRDIVKILLEKTARLLTAQGMNLIVTDAAIDEISKRGYDPQFGARPLRRIIQREIENPISNKILAGEFLPGESISVDFNNGFIFSK